MASNISNRTLKGMVDQTTAEMANTQHTLWNEINRRRKAERQLRELEELHYRILEAAHYGILISNSEGEITAANSCLEKVTGYTTDELRAKGFITLSPNSLHRRELFRIFNTLDRVKDWEIPLKRKDDTTIIALFNSECTELAGQKALVIRIEDITNHKLLEEQVFQAQKMEATGLLADGIAHDLNNLLNAINGYSEMALENISNHTALRKDIELILEAGKRAADLTFQLQAFYRKPSPQPEILNLNELITEMSPVLQRLIGKDIELTTNLQKDLGFIHADADQLQQILMNIALNSRDATPQEGRVIIKTANIDIDKDWYGNHEEGPKGPFVLLAVGDTGSGMDEKTRDRLFEPFFTTKRKENKNGLGLSTVDRIVKQSQGFIRVDSKPGQGTTFKIYFPRNYE